MEDHDAIIFMGRLMSRIQACGQLVNGINSVDDIFNNQFVSLLFDFLFPCC